MSIDRQFELEATIFALAERLRQVTDERYGLRNDAIAWLAHDPTSTGAEDEEIESRTGLLVHPDDDLEHQCGGPQEACCEPGCRECGSRSEIDMAAWAAEISARIAGARAALGDRPDLEETDPYHAVAGDAETFFAWARSVPVPSSAVLAEGPAEAPEEQTKACQHPSLVRAEDARMALAAAKVLF